MNEYDPDGAKAELRRVDGMTSENGKRIAVAIISTATLIDIAESLRVIATEASLAMDSYPVGGEPDNEQADEVSDVIVEGDLVAVDGYDEPAEVLSLGFTEGSSTVTVRFSSGAESRFWLANVRRLVGDERDDDTMQSASKMITSTDGPITNAQYVGAEGEESGPYLSIGDVVEADGLRGIILQFVQGAEGVLVDVGGEDRAVRVPVREVTVAADAVDPEDLVDDIDADFDGAESPEAASALDLLKANEAARKAAKKGKKK